MGDSIDAFPLFPLGLVLLPAETVPLHIFEERYKLMIGRCLEDDSEFGILWLSDPGLRDVGCSARVTEVLDRMPDGRLNILVTGVRPFRLVRRIEDLPYPAGEVEMLDEPAGGGDAGLLERVREGYAELVERVTDERPDEEELAGLDAYGMAATIELDADAKQELLELRTEDERLRSLDALFASVVRRMDERSRMTEVAQTNGKLRP